MGENGSPGIPMNRRITRAAEQDSARLRNESFQSKAQFGKALLMTLPGEKTEKRKHTTKAQSLGNDIRSSIIHLWKNCFEATCRLGKCVRLTGYAELHQPFERIQRRMKFGSIDGAKQSAAPSIQYSPKRRRLSKCTQNRGSLELKWAGTRRPAIRQFTPHIERHGKDITGRQHTPEQRI